MASLKFYDVKKRKSFTTDNYNKKTKVVNGKNGKRKITLAIARRDGREIPRIISNEKV